MHSALLGPETASPRRTRRQRVDAVIPDLDGNFRVPNGGRSLSPAATPGRSRFDPRTGEENHARGPGAAPAPVPAGSPGVKEKPR